MLAGVGGGAADPGAGVDEQVTRRRPEPREQPVQGGGLAAPPAGRGDVIARAEVEGDLGRPLGHGVELVGHGLVDVAAHVARTSRIRVAQSALTWAA